MNLLYPVHYRQDEENSELWEATIPGLDGTLEGPGTCGDNLEDCRKMAGGLVDAWLVTHMKQGNPIPIPGDLPVGDGWEQVGPSLRVAWVATLRRLREQSGMTQDEAATKLNVKQPVYARLEDPIKANPTLSTVERLNDLFGARMSLHSGSLLSR